MVSPCYLLQCYKWQLEALVCPLRVFQRSPFGVQHERTFFVMLGASKEPGLRTWYWRGLPVAAGFLLNSPRGGGGPGGPHFRKHQFEASIDVLKAASKTTGRGFAYTPYKSGTVWMNSFLRQPSNRVVSGRFLLRRSIKAIPSKLLMDKHPQVDTSKGQYSQY